MWIVHEQVQNKNENEQLCSLAASTSRYLIAALRVSPFDLNAFSYRCAFDYVFVTVVVVVVVVVFVVVLIVVVLVVAVGVVEFVVVIVCRSFRS